MSMEQQSYIMSSHEPYLPVHVNEIPHEIKSRGQFPYPWNCNPNRQIWSLTYALLTAPGIMARKKTLKKDSPGIMATLWPERRLAGHKNTVKDLDVQTDNYILYNYILYNYTVMTEATTL